MNLINLQHDMIVKDESILLFSPVFLPAVAKFASHISKLFLLHNILIIIINNILKIFHHAIFICRMNLKELRFPVQMTTGYYHTVEYW